MNLTVAMFSKSWEKSEKGRNNEYAKRHSSIIALALLASLCRRDERISVTQINPLFTYQDYFLSIYYRQKKKCYLFCFFKYSLSWWQIEYLFWFYF